MHLQMLSRSTAAAQPFTTLDFISYEKPRAYVRCILALMRWNCLLAAGTRGDLRRGNGFDTLGLRRRQLGDAVVLGG